MENHKDKILNFSFELTSEIIDQIIFTMEDQENDYVINVKTGELVVVDDEIVEEIEKDSGVFSYLPDWRSSDGFIMMEKFITSLHNPVYRSELRTVLSSGKGVFRNFKRIVKSYEPLKKKWYHFKDRYMKGQVIDWYSTNREAWEFAGKEIELYETGDLVESDFTFSDNFKECKEDIINSLKIFTGEVFKEDPLVQAYYFEQMQSVLMDKTREKICVCSRSLDETFAGVIWGWVWSREGGISDQPADTVESKNKILVVKEFFVEPVYRGLGVGEVLVERLSLLADSFGVGRIYFEVPHSMVFIPPMLEKKGYVPIIQIFSRSFPSLA